jgi:hypothetical protein
MTVTSPEPFNLSQLAGPQPPRKRRIGLIIAAIVAGVLAVAAGTAAATVALSSRGKPATTASPTWKSLYADGGPAQPAASTTATKTATVQQYASAVSPPIKGLRDSYATYRSNLCAARDASSSTLVCDLTVMSLGTDAKTLSLVLTGAVKPGVPAYIGPPPAEIEKLVSDTIRAADTVASALDSDGKAGPEFFLVVSSLMTTLDRWDPYL